MNPEGHMDPDKYQQAWQADAAQTRVTVDADLLMRELQSSHGAFRRMIFWRDVREVVVGLGLLPVWFVMGIALSLPWTWYLTVPALIWVAGFILVDRRRHPQRPSDPGEPLLFYVQEAVAQVEHQIWLLRNVFWWYLLPFCISILAFFFDVAWHSSSMWWEFVVVAGLSILFLYVIYGWLYRLNQRAVREQLEPRRQELLKLVASLENETTSENSGDLFDLVSALSDPDRNCGLNSSWADNWNLLIPSWREATTITLATLGGALCGWFFWPWVPIDEMFPAFFGTVVGAVIAFEIALGWAWLRSRKKRNQSPPPERDSKTPDAGVVRKESEDLKPQRLPRAPALLILGLTLFVSIMAFVVLFLFMRNITGESQSRRGPGLDDVSAIEDDDVTDVDA